MAKRDHASELKRLTEQWREQLRQAQLDNERIKVSRMSSKHYTPYSARMNTHKLMGFYMEVLILGIIL